MVYLYSFLIRCYVLAIRLAALWHPKAARWVQGRKHLFDELQTALRPGDRIIWFHCASAGELEQGKPLIEALKEAYPGHRILISFFSPSGYDAGRKYAAADLVTYLPADTAAHARRFLELVQPELVVFVKYEFWYHQLSAIAFRHIPLLLVSAIFREGQAFFRPWGGLHRRMLLLFRRIFVQDEASLELLKKAGIEGAGIGGDTRFDRVRAIAGRFTELPLIQRFVGSDGVLVAGSTWPDDERLLEPFLKSSGYKAIIAPHELTADHLDALEKRFPGSLRYSVLQDGADAGNARVLLIDNFGMLSRLYRYATLTYVGGGFNRSGIHNTLEAAVWGKPVFFGPNYEKFREARGLVEAGAAFSVSEAGACSRKMKELLENKEARERAGKAAAAYVEAHTGATERILRFIQENRLLTR